MENDVTKGLDIDKIVKSAKKFQHILQSVDEESKETLDRLQWMTLIPLGLKPIDDVFHRIGLAFIVMGIASEKDVNAIIEEFSIVAAQLDQLHAHATLPSAMTLITEEIKESRDFRNVFMKASMASGNTKYGWVEFAHYVVEESRAAYKDSDGICKNDMSIVSNCNESLDQIQKLVDSYENEINKFRSNK